MGRDYEAVVDMSTASNGYGRSSLIELNSKAPKRYVHLAWVLF